MDRLIAEIIRLTQKIKNSSIEVQFGMILEKVQSLINAFTTLKTENAALKEQLAAALADDAADDEAVSTAQADAAAARIAADEAVSKSSQLQSIVDQDLAEDSQIEAAIDSVLGVSQPTDTVVE